jgi:hypothetical protein
MHRWASRYSINGSTYRRVTQVEAIVKPNGIANDIWRGRPTGNGGTVRNFVSIL